MAKFKAPSPRYLGPAFHTTRGTSNKPIRRIVIHSTVGPTKAGSAEKIATYFKSSRSGGSAHYVVDAGGVVQVVFDSVVAWHAPPNRGSIGIEMCDNPHPSSTARWWEPDHTKMFAHTARLTAELCLAYNVRPWFVTAGRLRLGIKGVTTHAEVSKAWRQSTHWDPGAWPVKAFMREVRREIKLIKAGK